MGAPKVIIPQKKHYCPTCGEVCKSIMVMPGKRMEYNCSNGHSNMKRHCIIK